MDLIRDVEYLLALARLIEDKAKRKIESAENKTISDEDRYYSSLLTDIEIYSEGLRSYHNKLHEKINEQNLFHDYDTLAFSYFELVKSLFEYLIQTDVTLSISLVEDILAQLDSILSERRYLRKNGTVVDRTIPLYMPNILRLKGILHDEILKHKLNAINEKNLVMITNELNKVTERTDREMNQWAKKYNDERAGLREIVDRAKESVEYFLNEAKSSIDSYKFNLDNIKTEMQSQDDKLKTLISDAEGKVQIAETYLKGASKEGMAKAFQDRSNELEKPMKDWMKIFFSCLILLVVFSIFMIFFSIFQDAQWTSLLSKIALAFPLVWGAWFSAKQYNHISQLREDYSYKVAVAMTYHGYKDEASDINKEMSEKLLESIIGQFSENPVRLYQNQNNASVVEALIKNDKMSDLLNVANKK